MCFLFIILKKNEDVLTFEGFRWGFAGGHLGGKHALAKYLYIKACIVKGHLGILLQLLGQVGPRSGRHGIGPVATVLRDLQLFHKTHRPVEKRVFSHNVYPARSFVSKRGGKHSPENSVRVWASGGWITDRGLRLWLLFMAFVFPCSSNRAARETKSVKCKKNTWLLGNICEQKLRPQKVKIVKVQYLRCVLRLLFTCPCPVHPGVGHFSTFSCIAKTSAKKDTLVYRVNIYYRSNVIF